jgi:predicted MPP superfamily phosphohydrolase
MKIVAIGDIHGQNIWKTLLPDINTVDKIVFLGDYVDSFHVEDEDMVNNLKGIIQFKKDNPNKVVLLLGNHCNQYMFYPASHVACSGFRGSIADTLHKIYQDNKDLFQIAYQHENYLFTHAGLCSNWFYYSFIGNDSLNIAKQLNEAKGEQYDTLFHVGRRRGGRNASGGVFWCDKSELLNDLLDLDNLIQVVGHNRVFDIEFHQNTYNSGGIYFIDCLENKNNKILTLEI